MKLTIVTFKIYDREAVEVFVNTTLQDIHEKLYDMCYTYVPIKIQDVNLSSIKGVDIDIKELKKFNPSEANHFE